MKREVFNSKSSTVKITTFNHVKKFLTNKNYVNLESAFENVKILIGASINNNIKFTNLNHFKNKKKFFLGMKKKFVLLVLEKRWKNILRFFQSSKI